MPGTESKEPESLRGRHKPLLSRKVDVWAYCLMPNHVHLILTPTRSDGLGLAVGEAHRRYTNFINARGRGTGHRFQSRFASVAMDELHRLAAVSYISLNPVRAGLVGHAADLVLYTCCFPNEAVSFFLLVTQWRNGAC